MSAHSVTINFKEVDLEIEYDYQPYERAVMYYSDGSGYPGCAEEVEITKVAHMGEDITELCEIHFDLLTEKVLEDLHKEIDY